MYRKSTPVGTGELPPRRPAAILDVLQHEGPDDVDAGGPRVPCGEPLRVEPDPHAAIESPLARGTRHLFDAEKIRSSSSLMETVA